MPDGLITSCITAKLGLMCFFSDEMSNEARENKQNKNQPTFFVSMHSTMEKFLDDVCKQPPPEQPSCSGCSTFGWEHTWTACQPHAGVCRWKTYQQVWLSVTRRWCSAAQHKHMQMHAARWSICKMQQEDWIKDHLVVKLELLKMDRSDAEMNICCNTDTNLQSSKVLRTVELFFWNVNSTTFLCSTLSSSDAHYLYVMLMYHTTK